MKIGKKLLCLLIVTMGSLWAESPYTPLQLYSGSWRITRKDSPKPDELKNQCELVGKFFTCQQTVNGEVSALLIFIPEGKPGHYVTQSINPDGRALGRGELQINGNQWVYTSIWNQGNGQDVYFKTTNVFSGRDHIHYEQQQSANGKDWTTKNSGDETRVGR